MAGMFFGSREDELIYYAKKGVDAPDRPEADKPKEEEEVEIQVLDLATLEPITDAERRILSRTRCEHDPMTVYMQSDINFYDAFYNEESIDNPILKQVRSLRKVYRDYRKYKDALAIRDAYLDHLLETQYGGDVELFNMLVLHAKGGSTWVPPRPIFNNTTGKTIAELDHDLLDIGSLWEKPSEEKIEQIVDYWNQQSGIDLEHVKGIYTEPLLDVDVIFGVQDVVDELREMEESANRKRKQMVSNINSNIKDIIRSWYDTAPSQNEEDTSRFFRYTPEKLEKLYYESMIEYELDPRLSQIMTNPDANVNMSNYDPDAIVYDPETNRPMKASELDKRKMVRMLGKCGWNELEMMKRFDIGTRHERSKLERREQKTEANRYKVTPETMALRMQLEKRQNDDYMTTNQTRSITDELDALLKGGIY